MRSRPQSFIRKNKQYNLLQTSPFLLLIWFNHNLNLSQLKRNKPEHCGNWLRSWSLELSASVSQERISIFSPHQMGIKLCLSSSRLNHISFVNCECTISAGQSLGEVLHSVPFSGKSSDLSHSTNGPEDHWSYTGTRTETQHYLFEFFTTGTSCFIFTSGTR